MTNSRKGFSTTENTETTKPKEEEPVTTKPANPKPGVTPTTTIKDIRPGEEDEGNPKKQS
ncbi:hypothetical protein IMCC3317_17990 [Kordia antarctica]|uniref:Uncharacterized protein n=1 Tax=Kordia antarctica TaxID=1218801 RepID=A0A7L4ZJQ5_9FLAO|nr:hypothetical protein [Kordia antarctica]QHI36436.1 hypothetical protein IMCC3317_17990 [Kordia antarctica]